MPQRRLTSRGGGGGGLCEENQYKVNKNTTDVSE